MVLWRDLMPCFVSCSHWTGEAGRVIVKNEASPCTVHSTSIAFFFTYFSCITLVKAKKKKKKAVYPIFKATMNENYWLAVCLEVLAPLLMSWPAFIWVRFGLGGFCTHLHTTMGERARVCPKPPREPCFHLARLPATSKMLSIQFPRWI